MLGDGLGDASLLFSQVEGFLNKASFSTKKKKRHIRVCNIGINT